MPRVLHVLIIAIVLAGCATIPAQEMSDARQAIQSAEQAGAGIHAARALDTARHLLEQAEAELAVKNYAGARRTAYQAKTAAIQAREAADDAARKNGSGSDAPTSP